MYIIHITSYRQGLYRFVTLYPTPYIPPLFEIDLLKELWKCLDRLCIQEKAASI